AAVVGLWVVAVGGVVVGVLGAAGAGMPVAAGVVAGGGGVVAGVLVAVALGGGVVGASVVFGVAVGVLVGVFAVGVGGGGGGAEEEVAEGGGGGLVHGWGVVGGWVVGEVVESLVDGGGVWCGEVCGEFGHGVFEWGEFDAAFPLTLLVPLLGAVWVEAEDGAAGGPAEFADVFVCGFG